LLLWNATRLVARFCGGVRPRAGTAHGHEAVVNGCNVVLVEQHGKVSWVFVNRGEDVLYSGRGVRDGLRAALRRRRQADVDLGGTPRPLLVEVRADGTARLSMVAYVQLGGVVVEDADPELRALADAFIRSGGPEGLLDWLSERHSAFAREVEAMHRNERPPPPAPPAV
jgi:hypothetical protein